MKATETKKLMNATYVLGIMLLVVVFVINCAMSWGAQNLFWLPICAWVVSMFFALITAVRQK